MGACRIYRKEEGMGDEFKTYFITCTVYFISYSRYNLLIEEKNEEGAFLPHFP
ncbi:hypothetical protein BC2926_53330 [Bacillus cereus]|nr:hypothetical protein BC2926_53330 [Bacillus cereus]